ncbi:MAG: hypothetical protein IMZ66_05675 [Planctomycetes bacterium]|nr:hypothetical protein [Planctomycetota bacterium]
MSILFRCPCGRSMVVESDRAGAVVTCPNCRRSLKVPSGKGRGVEIPAAPTAATTRTSRRCKRCRKDVPVDSQICPHCKTILTDGAGAAAAPAKPARPSAAAAAATAVHVANPITAGTDIVYGGARGNWFTRLSSGGKAGVIIGGVVFLILLGIVFFIVGTGWQAGQRQLARQGGQDALVEGRRLACRGGFQEAYDLYFSALNMKKYLRESGVKKDTEIADELELRTVALQYLVADPKTRESVLWKPKSQEEFDQTMAHLKATYPAYRQLCLAVAGGGLAAIQVGKSQANRAAFEEKVGQTLEAYVRFVGQTTPQQRAQFTFQIMTQALRELTTADRKWDEASRNAFLTSAEARFNALKERVSKPTYDDAIW